MNELEEACTALMARKTYAGTRWSVINHIDYYSLAGPASYGRYLLAMPVDEGPLELCYLHEISYADVNKVLTFLKLPIKALPQRDTYQTPWQDAYKLTEDTAIVDLMAPPICTSST